MLILVLAANTAYADFPRLASIVARDRFLPRQFMNQGDRLAFSNGILILSVLAGAAAGRVRRRHARAHSAVHDRRVRLVHAVAGREWCVHWRALRAAGLAHSARSTASAPIVTGIVLLIVAITKAAEGAWIIIVMIPIAGRDLRDHAPSLRSGGGGTARCEDWHPEPAGGHVVLVPIGGMQRAVVKALRYARTLSTDVRAVYVEIDPAATPRAAASCGQQWGQGVPLVVLESPYRSLMEPLLEYIEQLRRERSGRLRHRHPAGVRAAPAVASPPAQPARAADQGGAPLQAEHRRHERAVPPRPERAGAGSNHRRAESGA